MSDSKIEPYFKEKMNALVFEDLDEIKTYLYIDQLDLFLVYIMDNLDKFHIQLGMGEGTMPNGDEFAGYLFYWDISKDPVFPYLSGDFQTEFHENILSQDGQYVALSLDLYNGASYWALFVFTNKFKIIPS